MWGVAISQIFAWRLFDDHYDAIELCAALVKWHASNSRRCSQFRLSQCGLEHVIYLVENHGSLDSHTVLAERLQTAMATYARFFPLYACPSLNSLVCPLLFSLYRMLYFSRPAYRPYSLVLCSPSLCLSQLISPLFHTHAHVECKSSMASSYSAPSVSTTPSHS